MREVLAKALPRILSRARAVGRDVLLETEAYTLVEALGIETPAHVFLSDAEDLASIDLNRFPGEQVVVKVVAPEIVHKSMEGGVQVVPKQCGELLKVLRAMEERFQGRKVVGYNLHEYIEHDGTLGGELLLGMHWTGDFGPVVSLGLGGVHANFLAEVARPGMDLACFAPGMAAPEEVLAVLESKAFMRVISGPKGGGRTRIEPGLVRDIVVRFLDFAGHALPAEIAEFEINPLVFRDGRPVALDAFVKLAGQRPEPLPARPLARMKSLLEPQSLAIIGVSERPNPGNIMVRNTLRAGFDPQRLYLVKPGMDVLLGCRCFPDIASLPEPVDLLIVSVSADQVPALVDEVVDTAKARSIIVIPGGMGERSGSENLVERVRGAVKKGRASSDGGPVINGANCLGIRSLPGRYDTLFIPSYKLPKPESKPAPVAVISQSGAFAVARASELPRLNPRYLVSIGNQVDLSVGDYLHYLKDDPGTRIFACYVEGFQALDGRHWLQAAREITASGRAVILYRAGRTSAGAHAAASHTASLAGDYTVTRELAEAAGVVVAESLADFEGLVRMFLYLDELPVTGWNLGAVSNAGFECVAMADNAGSFRLPPLAEETVHRLDDIYREFRLEQIVDVHNPVDLTAIMSDQGFVAAARAVLEDPGVDVGIIGCVPLTGALQTLPPSGDHGENVFDVNSVARRLGRLKDEVGKPWVGVVDGGPVYNVMAGVLDEIGVPAFRSADRALRLFAQFCRARLRKR